MPIASSTIASNKWLRLLVLGAPRVGKTTTVLRTCPKPAYVIQCDALDGTPMKAAASFIPDFGDYDIVRTAGEMDKAITTAREGITKGRYKTVILDTLSNYSGHLIEQCLRESLTKGGEENGMQAYPSHNRRLRQTIFSFLRLEAHAIVLSHYEVIPGTLDSQLKKSGDGIVPAVAGSARLKVAGLFDDVVWMQMVDNKRTFYCNTTGAWGPGSRSLPGTEAIDADINLFISLIAKLRLKQPSVTKPGMAPRRT